MKFLYGYSMAAELRPATRYDQIAEALGCHSELVERPDELRPALERAFAAGLPDWMRGYYTDPADVARARAQLARERVGAAVMLDSGDAFTASWPALAADLRARGLVPEHLELATQDVELWVMPSGRRDSATGLPCTPAE